MSVAAAVRINAPLFAPMLDEGMSAAARSVRGTVAAALNPGPTVTESFRDVALQRLFAALRAAHNKPSVFADTARTAIALIESLPAGTTPPEVVIEQDGEIGFDWQESRRRVLSLTIGPSGMIGYAALVGSEPIYGKAPFGGHLPETVAHLLRRVLSAES
jgi:hypothetical protein